MDDEIKKFIEKNIDLIEHENFEALYQRLRDPSEATALTETLLGAGIDPASYMEKIPERYLQDSAIQSYVIPNGINAIDDYAFSGCENLKSVKIPGSVTYIDRAAFHGCSGLVSITIGNSVTSIGDSAFKGCSSLTGVTIPGSVISIGGYVFKHAKNLESINYLGTKDQWNKIKLKPLWNKDSHIEKIECKDGVIELK